jgi:hypothetical protein
MAIFTDSQTEFHALLDRQDCVPSEHQRWASREQINALYVSIVHCWREDEQQVIIRFIVKENANADDIHRKFQAQFPDDPDRIQSVRCWHQARVRRSP